MTKKRTSKIGAHVSIAGGVDKAPARAAEQGCETFQSFTRSPQGGPAPELTPALIKNFHAEMKKYGMETFYIHAPYYINFASLKNNIRYGSISVIRQELERGSLLGSAFIMAHIGSHTDQTLEEGIEKSSKAIEKVLDGYQGTTQFLIEISAGAGSVLGDKFEEVGEIIRPIKHLSGFGGVCFDTCHAFASGYDFRTTKGTRETLKEFAKYIGLEYLKLTHVNDSKFDLGQHHDRHEHIDKGFLGKVGIENILTTPEFSRIDWILETEDEGRKADVEALKLIRS
jgi:deoxyribonuclease-4